MVKTGSLWTSTNSEKFRVISVIEVDGHTWVYYRKDGCNPNTNECQEFSCYLESFEQRFNLQVE